MDQRRKGDAPRSSTPPRPVFRVLVVDDDPVMLEACRSVLERNGLRVDTEQDAFEGRDRAIRGLYDVLLLDLRMPGLDGLEVLRTVRERRPDIEVVMITAYSSVASAVKAVKLGAYDYLPKPFTPEELMERVRAALAHREQKSARHGESRTPQVVGESPAMAALKDLVARVAPTDATILIFGETGSGKEVIANTIHAASRRRDGPFVSVDCTVLSPGLLESELFGHVKGSFTGATTSKPGLFEVADEGTLFLDEVASLALETQAKLLRFLETGEFRPVGGVEVRRVDVRVLAATNRDLAHLVSTGQFREDLFYRLNVVPLRIPPLRERASDIPLLVRHFLDGYSRGGASTRRFSPDALRALMDYPWPGNVRELRNLVERLVVTVEGETIEVYDLPEEVREGQPPPRPTTPANKEELKALKKVLRDHAVAEVEQAFVLEALRRNAWNVTRAARDTGLQRPNFHALMRKYGIRAEDPGEPLP